MAEAVTAGRDPRRITTDLLEHLRNGFLALTAPDLVLVTADVAAGIEAQARGMGLPALVRAIEVLGEALAEMRDSVDPRITLEVALVRLTRPEADHSPAALLERLDRLERAVADSGGRAAAPGAPPPATTPETPGPAPRPSPRSKAPAEPASPPAGGATAPAPPAGRAALGAHRRGGQDPPGPARQASSPRQSSAPQQAAPAQPSAATAAVATATATLPSRDQLTKAWGDHVLAALSGKAKSRLSSGRFAAVEGDAAVFALPDRHWLDRCQEVKPEAEAALAAHFGRSVPLRLVVDQGQVQPGPAPAAREEPEVIDVTELRDAPPGLMSPEQRLLEAFPGAEEVLP